MSTQPALPIEKNAPQNPVGAQHAAPLPQGDGPKDLVIARGCSQFGLHRMEIIRPKVPVDQAKWVWSVEQSAVQRGVGLQWASVFAYEESAAGFWHLRLYWKEIEITENSNEQ